MKTVALFLLVPLAFFLSIAIPMGIAHLIRKKNKKLADHPAVIFAVLTLMYCIYLLLEYLTE